MLADFCRHTSDPFQLNAALSQLSDAYVESGNVPKAEEVLQEMVERNKDDERLVERLNQLRSGGGPSKPVARPVPMAEPRTFAMEEACACSESPPIPEEPLDEETQRYVSQALTDVDLFSSYGLTQKAAHLLESVLERAPRHTPTLERLLDMQLGAGNDRRTAELAAQLEQIHRSRGDTRQRRSVCRASTEISGSCGNYKRRFACDRGGTRGSQDHVRLWNLPPLALCR